MSHIFCLLMITVFFAAGPLCSSARAQDVPESERGIWNTGPCSETRAAVALGRDFAILFETDPEKGQLISMGPVRWSGETAVLWQGGAPTVLPPPEAMTRCANMPAPAYAAMGEALALFFVFDEIAETCGAGTGRDCAGAIFDFADVSDDRKLSLAEVSRLVPAGTTFVSYETLIQNEEGAIKVPVSALSGTTALVSFAGPMVTRNLLSSYDFDGDGFLTLEEVMQDREPLFDYALAEATGTALGAAFVQSLVAQSVTILSQGAGQMLGPVLGGMIR